MVDADPSTLPQPPFDRAGRDAYRTPMQWDASERGGFTSGEPWLPLVDPESRNVAAQRMDQGSILSLYRRLIAARRKSPALAHGAHRSLFEVGADVLAWFREADDERVLLLLNVSGSARACDLRRVPVAEAEIIVSTGERTGRVELAALTLQPYEGIALRL